MQVQAISRDPLPGRLYLASKIAFEAQMEKSLLNKKYWDELLEKLRKSGGGGGGYDKRFDQIAVSMMLTNFLRNKVVQAMMRNLNNEFLRLFGNLDKFMQQDIFNGLISNFQTVGKTILQRVTNLISLIIRRDVALLHLYKASTQLSSLIGILSFQLNKLKEFIEEHLKKIIRNVKKKIKNIQTALTNFFIELEEKIINGIGFLKGYVEKYLFPSIKTGTPRITQ